MLPPKHQGQVTFASTTAPPTVTVPPGNVGDLLICDLVGYGANGSMPAGWTKIAEGFKSVVYVSTWIRVVQSGDPEQVVVTGGNNYAIGVISRYSGVHAVPIQDAKVFVMSGDTGTSLQLPSVMVSDVPARIHSYWCCTNGQATLESGMQQHLYAWSDVIFGLIHYTAGWDQYSAGASPNRLIAFPASNAYRIGTQVAIAPGSAPVEPLVQGVLLGDTPISSALLGDLDIPRIYLGDVLLFSKGSPGAKYAEFDFTGDVQTFVVPQGVTSVTVECWGAQGGTGSADYIGGRGGYSRGDLAVTPGETLHVYVGGMGSTNKAIASPGGGGATDVRKGGTALSDRRIVAGGGGGFPGGLGGAAAISGAVAGTGGGASGGAGSTSSGGLASSSGGGGTQSAGGVGGANRSELVGSLGVGGSVNIASLQNINGGGWNGGGHGAYYPASPGTLELWFPGGGGGYYGGGGGYANVSSAYYLGGAGGGSGYVGGVTNSFMESGVRESNGRAKISWQ